MSQYQKIETIHTTLFKFTINLHIKKGNMQ